MNSEAMKKKANICPSAIYNAAPDNYEKIPFSRLNSHSKFEDKAIIGKISLLNPIGKRVNGFIRKLLITDCLEEQLEDKKLTVFLLNQFAEQSQEAELGAFIKIANFLVEKSTHHKEDELPFQILVQNEDSRIWFMRKRTPAEQNNKKTIKRSLLKNDSLKEEPKTLKNHYEYTPLGELQESQEKSENYNVYGIVEKCDLKVNKAINNPKQILEVSLTDKTETDFVCSIYSPKGEAFPDIYPGDIIRIHRMQVSKFRGKLKGKCPSSKFILVFSKQNEGQKPRTVAKSFTFTEEDASKVKNLFQWYDKKNQPKLISDIKRGDFVNIICQVIGVYVAKNSETVIVKIWDGTKSNEIECTHWGLREEKLDEKLFLIAKNYFTVLHVYGHHCSVAAELKPGQFIEVRDAHVYSPKDNPDDCKLCLFVGNKDKRGIEVVNLDDGRLNELKERLGKLVADAEEFGNQTEAILSEDNSIFLNCDISAWPTSQKSCLTQEECANIDALNIDVSQTNGHQEPTQEPQIVSVVKASIQPGQATQEFSETMQKEYHQADMIDENEEGELPAFTQPDLAVNKTPLGFRLLLHNPSSQDSVETPMPPFTSDTPEEWWTSIPAVSVADGHENVKPSSLADVIKHEVPYKFRIFCVILAYKPNFKYAHELIRIYCPSCWYMTDDLQPNLVPLREQDGLFYFHCPDCLKNSHEETLQYTYMFSLDVHDGTGPSVLEVNIWGENAVKFLKGIPPEEVLRNPEAANSVLNLLWSICPNSRPLNNPAVSNTYPILDCAIMSYTISDQVFYQLFDTKLL